MTTDGAGSPVGAEAAVGWEEARAANLLNWEDRAALHVDAYGLDAFRADPQHLSSVVRQDLEALERHLPGGVRGRSVLHLQCHIGTDTVSLARAGASQVTGLDFSRAALAAASSLATELGCAVSWIEADVLDARAAVTAHAGTPTRFDVVYTSIGAICWLADLDRWAAQVAALLEPGGVFYIRDGHPALYALDEDADGLVTRYPYFGDGRALAWDDSSTYAGAGTVTHTRTYEWPHPLSEVVTALLGAGLELVALEEGRTLPWRFSARMVERADGDFEWPGEDARKVPCTFTVVARRP